MRVKKLLEFFCYPINVGCPITAESWAEILLSAKRSVYAGRVKQRPQPAPPGCGLPIHFIHFIAAAVTNRGPNLREGIRVIMTKL